MHHFRWAPPSYGQPALIKSATLHKKRDHEQLRGVCLDTRRNRPMINVATFHARVPPKWKFNLIARWRRKTHKKPNKKRNDNEPNTRFIEARKDVIFWALLSLSNEKEEQIAYTNAPRLGPSPKQFRTLFSVFGEINAILVFFEGNEKCLRFFSKTDISLQKAYLWN